MAVLMWWLIATERLDFSYFSNVLNHGNMLWAAAGLLLGLLCLVIPATRWYLILKIQYSGVTLLPVLRWMMIGFFFNLFAPGGIASDVTRSYYIMADKGHRRLAAISTVLLDRIIGFQTMLFTGFAILSWWLLYHNENVSQLLVAWYGLAFLLFSFFVGFALLVSRRTGRFFSRLIPQRLRESYEEFVSIYRAALKKFIPVYGLSLLNSFTNILLYMAAAKSLDLPLPLWVAALVVSLVNITSLLPVTPGGVGIGETLTADFMKGLTLAGGGAIVLLSRIMITLWTLSGAVFFILEKKKPRNGVAVPLAPEA